MLSSIPNGSQKNFSPGHLNFPIIPTAYSMKNPLLSTINNHNRLMLINNPLFQHFNKTDPKLSSNTEQSLTSDPSLPSKIRSGVKITQDEKLSQGEKSSLTKV